MLNALKSGALDISSPLDPTYAPQASALRSAGDSVYGYPDLGFFDAIFNFKDTANHFNSIISQLYARQALAYLQNQAAYVTGIYKGAAVGAYGPVPSVPRRRSRRRTRSTRPTRTTQPRPSRCSRATAGMSCRADRRPAPSRVPAPASAAPGIPKGTPVQVRLGLHPGV